MTAKVELYRFARGSTVWTWTSANTAIVYDGDTYTPETIGRGKIIQSSDMNRNSLKVTVPRDNPLGAAYIAHPQDQLVLFTLYAQKDGSTKVIWKGRIASHSATDSEVTLTCEPGSASQRRSGVYGRYQKTCGYALYGRGCNLDSATFAVAGTCTSVDGADVVVTEAASLPAGDLIGGMIEMADGVQKYVMNHVGDTLTLKYPWKALSDAVAGGPVAVTVYPGCAHNFTACLNKFNNLDNYGGCPWIPETDLSALSPIA